MQKEIISKGKYTQAQPEQLVSLKQYIFLRGEKGGKQIMLRLSNERGETCNAFSFILYQIDARGNVIGEEYADFSNRRYGAGETFSLDRVFDVQEKCTDIRFRLVHAQFGDYTYRPEQADVTVVYEPAKASLTETPAPRHGGARRSGSRVVRRAWSFAVLALLILAVSFVTVVALLRDYMDTNNIFSLSGVQYEFVDPENKEGDVIVTGYTGLLGNMLIPAEIEGHTVVGIRENAFVKNYFLRQVRVEGVDVSQGAFSLCTNLQDVQLVGVKNIAGQAFYNCDSLLTVTVEGAERIGQSAFADCTRLKSFTVSHADQNVPLHLEDNAISECVQLETVSISQLIVYPENKAIFRGNMALKTLHLRNFSYTLPDTAATEDAGMTVSTLFGQTTVAPTLTHLSIDLIDKLAPDFCRDFQSLSTVSINESKIDLVPAHAFSGCSSLVSFKTAGFVRTVEEKAFFGTALTSFDGSALVDIGNSAFEGCMALAEIKIPLNGVLATIGEGAFANCGALTAINIPVGVTELKDKTFMNCAALSAVVFAQEGTIGTIPLSCFENCGALRTLTLPESVTEIGERAFAGCASMVRVDIPQHVTAVHKHAFLDCKALESLRFTAALTTIGERAFANTALTQFTVPNSVTEIGFAAFENCTKLAELTLPYLGGTAEADASELRLSYVFGAAEQYAEGVVPAALKSVTLTQPISRIENYAFYACSGLEILNYSGTVSEIGNYAFAKCSALSAWDLSDVTSLGLYAFYDSGLTSISIPEGYTSVPTCAFWSCKNLAQVQLPDTLTEIAKSAFSACTALKDISFPASLVSIGESAFAGCAALTDLVFPSELSSIGANAFEGCAALCAADLPDSLQTLGARSFAGCAALTELSLPATMNEIGESAFRGCTALGAVEVPAGLGFLARDVFADCTALSTVTLPEDLRYINSGVFENCTSLLEILLPQTLIQISSSAFKNTGLCAVHIPASVIEIGKGAFEDCAALTEMTVPFVGGTPQSANDFGYIFNKANDQLPAGLKKVTVKPGASISIPSSAFAACASIEEVVLGEGVQSIDYGAFQNCPSLIYLSVPSSLRSVSYGAFYDTYHLYEIDNHSSWVSMQDYVASVILCKTSDFERADTVAVGEFRFACYGKDWYLIDYDKELAQLMLPSAFRFEEARITDYRLPQYLFYNNEIITTVILPGAVRSVGKNAFYNCYNLASVSMSKGLFEIAEYAFYNCRALTSLSLPQGLERLGAYAFGECAALQTVTMAGGMKEIERGAFAGCYTLASVVLSKDLTRIGEDAFVNCNNLFDVYYTGGGLSLRAGSLDHGAVARNAVVVHTNLSDSPSSEVVLDNGMTFRRWQNEWLLLSYSGTNKTLDFTSLVYEGSGISSIRIREYALSNAGITELVMGAEVKEIQRYAFQYCSELKTVHMSGNSLVELESYAFSNCNALRTVVLPDSLVRIGEGAFEGCRLLMQIDMPQALEWIGSRAFYNCQKLLSIVIPEGVTAIESDAFYGCQQLFEVYDLSTALTLNKGMYTNGYVARYAKVVYRSLDTQLLRAERDGFTFFRDNESVWYLYDYAGTKAMTLLAIPEIGNGVVILPNAFAGATVTALRVPDTTGQIKESALAGINGLTTIYFEGVMDEFNALKGKNYLTGNSWQDSQLKIYYQHYEHCVHGEGQWAEVNGVIITTPCKLIVEETTPPTCDAYGVLTSKCGCEGCTYYETAPIDMIEHVFENGACTGCDKKQILLTAESFAELEAEMIIVNNGFLLTDGELASTNKSASSTATIVFKNTVQFTLSFDWHVSSEANFDVFSVTSNKRGVLLTASGENMSGTESIEVMTGERITVSYKKDGGNSVGLDRAMLTNVQIIY